MNILQFYIVVNANGYEFFVYYMLLLYNYHSELSDNKTEKEKKAETIAMEWGHGQQRNNTETKMKMKPRDVKAIFVHSHNNHTPST